MKQMLKIHANRFLHNRTFALTFLLSFCILLIPAIGEILSLYGKDTTELPAAWSYFGDFGSTMSGLSLRLVWPYYVMLILPIIGGILYGTFYYDDTVNGVLLPLITRESKYRYWISGIIVTFCSAFLVVFFSIGFTRILYMIAVPLDSLKFSPYYDSLSGDTIYHNILFGKTLFINNPYIYYFIYTLIPAFQAGLLAISSFVLSLFTKKNRLAIALLPGISVLIIDLIISILGYAFHIYPSFQLLVPPTVSGIELWNVVTWFLLLIIVDIVGFILGVKKNRDILN